MFNGKNGLFIGCAFCLIVLLVLGVISFSTFCGMTALIVSLAVIVFIGNKAYRKVKSFKQPFQARLSRWSTKSRKMFAKKLPFFRKAKLMKELQQLLSDLKKDMEAFTLTWSTLHSNQQHPKLVTLISYQVFASELQSLTKSLNHLGKPGDDARLRLDDLKFYIAWTKDLNDRFAKFQQLSMQQEKKVLHALATAKRSHVSLGESYKELLETREFWTIYGSFSILENFLTEGYIPAEAILSQMQSLQSEMEQILNRYEHDFVYRIVL